MHGASVNNGSALNGGNSFAMGPETPKWARNWQFQQLMESKVTIWSFVE